MTDERVPDVRFGAASPIVDPMHGRGISALLAARLARDTSARRAAWRNAGGGCGIHWPEIDEDLSTEGLLRGVPAHEAAE